MKMVLYDWSVTKEEDFIGQVHCPFSALVTKMPDPCQTA